jgi:hypothetical protein
MRTCRVCKCTEDRACDPPCAWEPYDNCLCTTCAEAIRALKWWRAAAFDPNMGRLITAVVAVPHKARGATR